MRRLAWLVAFLLASAAGVAVAGDEERIITLESGEYATAAAAQAVWRPIEKGTPPVEVADGEGPHLLKLPCNFASNGNWRVGWDRQGQWDLSPCQTIEMETIADRDKPAGMILYFHSGGGWYGCSFAVPPGRQTTGLPRKNFRLEGSPAGWDKVDVIRLAITNDEGEDRAILVGRLGGVALPARVAVYRNDGGIHEEGSVPEYVRQMADALDRVGVAYEIIGDAEAAGGRLNGKTLAILPLNPVLDKAAAAAVEKFAADGGKLLVCYRLPAPLDKLLGVTDRGALQGPEALNSFAFRPAAGGPELKVGQESWWARRIAPAEGTQVRAFWIDRQGRVSTEPAVTRNANGFFIGHVLTPADQAAKDRLLLAMLGELWPEMWPKTYAGRQNRFGALAGFKNAAQLLEAARAGARRGDRQAGIEALLQSSGRLRGEAEAAAREGNFASATDLLGRSQDALLRAYATGVPGAAGEFRGVWCHDPAGVAGLSWDQAMKRLADAGFNAVFPNMLWGGASAGTSRLLPRARDLNRDLLAECVAAGKKHGVAVHVWKVNWNLWPLAPEAFRQEMLKAGRLQADRQGKTIDWLCPSHPDNQKLELESLLEVVRNYEVAGIHLDYIRYPGLEGCYCAGCRQRFEDGLGAKVGNWPGDVTDGALRDKYLQFRRDQITRLVTTVSEETHKLRPGVKISAAVFPHWPSARNHVGQDWKLWVEKGWLDFVCPMQYTESAAMFEARTRQSGQWVAGRIPLMPGIGATLGQSPDETLEQVLIARRQKCAGFVLFNYDRQLAAALDLLQLGATGEKTRLSD
ncbi:MAG: family 10 glycosylhydrolase [Planctomycetota bacterium]